MAKEVLQEAGCIYCTYVQFQGQFAGNAVNMARTQEREMERSNGA